MVAAASVIAVLLVALGVTMVVQAGRVRRERDRATAEAAKASAINAFLLDALGAADPWSKGSRNVSLLDALRQAQDKARTSFVNQPLVEASVLQTIGTTFANLAEYPEAEKALTASLDLRVKAAGAKSAEAAESLAALSEMYSAVEEVRRGREIRPRGGRHRARASRRRQRRGRGGDVPPRDRATPGAERPRRRRRRPRRCCGSCARPAPWDRRRPDEPRRGESRDRRAPHPPPGLPSPRRTSRRPSRWHASGWRSRRRAWETATRGGAGPERPTRSARCTRAIWPAPSARISKRST